MTLRGPLLDPFQPPLPEAPPARGDEARTVGVRIRYVEELLGECTRLLGESAGVDWASTSATAFRSCVGELAAEVRGAESLAAQLTGSVALLRAAAREAAALRRWFDTTPGLGARPGMQAW